MRYDIFINGQLCDLDSDSLIVLTYTMEQLNNPTAIRNTYSHEVEIPQTERNDRIFSHYYRNDYRVNVGNFSPLDQVPFEIRNELGERTESGYIKLDEVAKDNNSHKYKVVLYGGLGSFFYAMANGDDGEALTLADLQYMENAEDEGKLNFRIGRAVVGSTGAWGRLAGTNNATQYDVVNFAPTYQGLPEGEFDADKAIYVGKAVGRVVGDKVVYNNTLASPIYGLPSDCSQMYKRTEADGTDTGYRFALVELAKEYTEWETKDLRSYLQRPILSVRKFFEAVQRRATALGYTLTLDRSFFSTNNPYYDKAWMTLPSLQTLTRNSDEVEVQISGEIVVDEQQTNTIGLTAYLPNLEGYDFGATMSKASVTINTLSVAIPNNTVFPINSYYLRGRDWSLSGTKICKNAWFVQVYGENDLGDVVCWSDSKVLMSTDDDASVGEVLTELQALGSAYTPIGSNPTYTKVQGYFKRNGENVNFTKSLKFDISAVVDVPTAWYVRIVKKTYNEYNSDGAYNRLYGVWVTANTEFAQWSPFSAGAPIMAWGGATIKANENVRSDALINKAELFDIGKTPLEVMLSYTKLFGLVWLYDQSTKSIAVMPRTKFYNGNTIDLKSRIDHSREQVVKPFEFDKRYYDFELEAQGDWVEQYADKYGIPYGRQRIDTGYNFDRDSKNLLEGNALKGGAEVLEQSKQFCNITEDGKICPSVFLDGGSYTLYGDGSNNDIEMPTNSADIDYWNTLQGYDWYSKVQMHGKGNDLVDEAGVLLFFVGNTTIPSSEVGANRHYARFKLSDDYPEMSILNGGVPCWVLEGGAFSSLQGETIPRFARVGKFIVSGYIVPIGFSLDMGVPNELDTPTPDMEAVSNTIYAQYWRDYIADRYDQNSRVCTCYVDLRGLQVSNALFRNFYYFDNAVWVLNRIINYSMTTVGTTQCEFVKVQDVNNYNG